MIWEKYWPTTAGVDKILSRYAYDSFQGAGKKQLQGTNSYYLVPSYRLGDDPSVDDYNNPAVAYDPQNQNYVVVFSHFQDKGLDSSRLIYGQRLENSFIDSNQNIGLEIDIETTIKINYIPEITYSGIRDEMYVVYLTETEQKGDTFYSINQRTLRGQYANPILEIRRSVANGYLDNPVAAGTSDGRALVVWNEEYFQEPHDYDINAQRIKAFSKLYLPSVVR